VWREGSVTAFVTSTPSPVGEDEFAALLQEMSRPEDAVFVAKRLYTLSRPFVHKGQDIYVTASVGIALVPEAGGGRGAP
jgi:GGDEF domain-containing protein